MPGLFESSQYGEREPYPAESANRWVNQEMGPVLLDNDDRSLRSVNELVGEFRRKSLLFLYPDRSYGSLLLGSFPDVVSRWRSGDNDYGNVDGVKVRTMIDYAKMSMALQVLRSGSMFPAPDGRVLQYSEDDFRAKLGMSSYEAERWKERNVRGLRLTTVDRYASRSGYDGEARFQLGSEEPVFASYLEEVQREEQKRGKGWVPLVVIGGGIVFVQVAACAPVQATPSPSPRGPTEQPIFPSATHRTEVTPTALAGGPDDEQVVNPITPWPSLSDILAVRADGGPFTFDAEAYNVQAQLETVRNLVSGSGWAIVSTPDQLTLGRTAFVAPFQDAQQWSIQALTADGVMIPVRADGVIMDRPDWATTNVNRYDELEHGLGSDFPARYELVNDHWVAVVRTNDGRRAGYYDIFSGEWVFDQAVVVTELTPTTCLDPEVNQQVVDEFLQDFGFNSLEQALQDRQYFTGHAGFENGPSWYRIYDLKVLGGYRFSLANQPGFRDGDYAHCILGASPHMGDVHAPIIIGVEKNGQWSQVTYFAKHSLIGVPPQAVLFSSEDADQWVEDRRGENIHALVVARYSQPGWDRDSLWHVGYDEVLPLLRNPNGHIMKYTRIPTTIAPSASFPNGMPGGLSRIIQDFDLQPGGDIGLFAFQITIEE